MWSVFCSCLYDRRLVSQLYNNNILVYYQLINCVILITVPPLFVIEFLHRVVDTFEDYFSECSENVVKDNYVVVYEVSWFSLYYNTIN